MKKLWSTEVGEKLTINSKFGLWGVSISGNPVLSLLGPNPRVLLSRMVRSVIIIQQLSQVSGDMVKVLNSEAGSKEADCQGRLVKANLEELSVMS